jgi:hypothetical protein
MVEAVEPELPLLPEPLLALLPPVEPLPLPELELPPDPELALVPELELLANAIEPVIVGLALCGVRVIVLPPDTQYEYMPEALSALPAVMYVPLGDGLPDTKPSPPACCTVPEQLHPPFAPSVHVREENPSTPMRTLPAPEHVMGVDE